jgi:predicted DNA-binding transcriptional regulator YafY
VEQNRLATIAHFEEGQTIRFRYSNWRGGVADRHARVIGLLYGSNEWHSEPQWLLKAYDIEKGAVRYFALRDMEPLP